MNQKIEECAAFFRRNPAYQRILECLLKKYRSFGRTAGTVRLNDATEQECEAARDLFGRSFSPPLVFKSVEFEKALQHTRYQGVSLKELLECYFGVSIQTKRAEREQLESSLLQILQTVRSHVQSPVCLRWLESLTQRKGAGYLQIWKVLPKEPDTVERALTNVCQSVEWLEQHAGEKIRLAVLSAQVTADPHALDGNTLAGKLLLHLMAFGSERPFPSSAEQQDELYFACGVLRDSISSSVTQVGVRLYTAHGEHPAFLAFRQLREPCTLTLTNLAGLTAANSPSGKAYLVENQMVFSQLCDQTALFQAPLICTSGQLQVAVLRLLDLLAASGTTLFYAGDFDGHGLSIAAQLMARYPEQLRLWHMNVEDYVRCCSEKPLSDASSKLLQSCTNSPLAAVAEAVRVRGCAGYQELLLPELQIDLTST